MLTEKVYVFRILRIKQTYEPIYKKNPTWEWLHRIFSLDGQAFKIDYLCEIRRLQSRL